MSIVNLERRKCKTGSPRSKSPPPFGDLSALVADLERLQVDLDSALAYAAVIHRDPNYDPIPRVVKCLEVAVGAVTVAISHGRAML